jgi:hypothetical protein
MSNSKRASLQRLYDHDERVAPWSGTAHGVLQAVNTYEHHEGVVRGTTRPERNMLRAVAGEFGKLDRKVFRTLGAGLADQSGWRPRAAGRHSAAATETWLRPAAYRLR